MPDRTEQELFFRKWAHRLAKHARSGQAAFGEELTGAVADLLRDAAEEEALRPGGGYDVLFNGLVGDEGSDGS